MSLERVTRAERDLLFHRRLRSEFLVEFSAARRTMSPHLSAEENVRLFGPATAPHGHNYRCRLTFRGEQLDPKRPLVRYDEIHACVRALRAELDHQYLNEVIGLKERPLTTESLAEYIYERVKSMMPLDRVRLHERADFFAEAWEDNTIFLGFRCRFTRRIDCMRRRFPMPRTRSFMVSATIHRPRPSLPDRDNDWRRIR